MKPWKNNFDGPIDLTTVDEEHVKRIKNYINNLEIFEITDFYKEDLELSVTISNEEYYINCFPMRLDINRSTFEQRLAFESALNLKTETDLQIRDLNERRDIYYFLAHYHPNYKHVNRPKNRIVKYPDFVVDLSIGIEIQDKVDDLAAKFYRYYMKKDTQFIMCQDLLAFIGDLKEFKELMKRLNPTIYKDMILAYSDPNYHGAYSIDGVVDDLINEILESKLIKYNQHHYKKYEVNILLSKIRYSFSEFMVEDFVEKIRNAYPNIIDHYELIICFDELIAYKIVDLQKSTLRVIEKN